MNESACGAKTILPFVSLCDIPWPIARVCQRSRCRCPLFCSPCSFLSSRFRFSVNCVELGTSLLYDNRNKCFRFLVSSSGSLCLFLHFTLHTHWRRSTRKKIFYFNNMLLDILPKHFAGNHFKWFNFFWWPSLSSDYLFYLSVACKLPGIVVDVFSECGANGTRCLLLDGEHVNLWRRKKAKWKNWSIIINSSERRKKKVCVNKAKKKAIRTNFKSQATKFSTKNPHKMTFVCPIFNANNPKY